MTTVALFGDSDIGRVRRINEDSFRLIPDRETIVVCDGMGGHAAGEVASQRAVETVEAYLMRVNELDRPPSLRAEGGATLPPEAEDLVWAVRLANCRVFQTAQSQKHTLGMGTTLVAARFLPGRAVICHVGDSRAYLFRNGKLNPITIDHSLVAELLSQNEITAEQARTFPDRNIITRALGTRPVVAVDVTVMPVAQGDWYLLCSDGLCGAIDDDEMAAVAARHAGDPTAAVEALIDAANAAGGHDNITVAIAEVRESTDSAAATTDSMTVPEINDEAMTIEQNLIDLLFDQQQDSSDYVGANTDKIAVHPLNP
jgi:protein phosphatase